MVTIKPKFGIQLKRFCKLQYNIRQFPHHHQVAWSVLDDTKQAQDDRDDVEEVDHDGSPLVAEEVKHLPLQHSDLEGSTGAETEFRDMMTYKRHSLCHTRWETCFFPPVCGVVAAE